MRWKLGQSHYLNTIRPARWRYSHNDQTTGELVEKEFIVPRHLDINDPKCWTNRASAGATIATGALVESSAEGEIVVCHQGKGLKGDIEFLGDPTPDMVPLDEEAQALSDSFAQHWAWKPDSEAFSSQPVNPPPAEIPGLADLVAAVTLMAQSNQELVKSLAPKRF